MTYEEAIKELRDNYVLTNGSVNGRPLFESIGVAIESLEKQIKYRWHDLRKNPEDLPDDGGYYLCIHDFGDGFIFPECLIWQEENDLGLHLGWRSNSGWIYGRTTDRSSVIAWREIEELED